MSGRDDLPNYPRTEEELNEWIANGVEESSTLDYKRAAALGKDEANEIAKDVSAFANSAGGVIIYGVAEHPKDSPKKHLPEKIDPVDGSSVTKEWLEHKISGGIQPRLNGVLIHPIRLAGQANGVVYVVVVPQGLTAHQTIQSKRYHRRFNFESVPMEDHEIRDIMHRVVHPQVKLEFELFKATLRPDMPMPGPQTEYHYLSISVFNCGRRLANNVFCTLYIPTEIIEQARVYFSEIDGCVHAVYDLDMSEVPPSSLLAAPVRNPSPLLPAMRRHIKTIRLIPSRESVVGYGLWYALHADEAPLIKENVKFVNIPKRPETGLPVVFSKNPFIS